MNTVRKCTIAVLMLSAIGLTACEQQKSGPAETAGRTLDQAARAAGDAVGDATQKTGQAISDTAITAAVMAAITAHSGLKGMQIHVETADGMVKLTGAVDAQADSDMAASAAKSVPGVKGVDNQLTVKATG